MTSSLDWAGLVPALAAAVQVTAAAAQVYWDRRRLAAAPAAVTVGVAVRTCGADPRTPLPTAEPTVSVTVRVVTGSGVDPHTAADPHAHAAPHAAGVAVPAPGVREKEHGSW
ncbi:hypothetical protein [Streptomyces sp. NPDC090025]|uniref:hypothetical protein n=1 Tax=Streptomyces sp. NPDC090025 TaxID=3365922 RepID=UPI0038377250